MRTSIKTEVDSYPLSKIRDKKTPNEQRKDGKRKKLGVKKDCGVIFIGFNYLAQAVLK